MTGRSAPMDNPAETDGLNSETIGTSIVTPYLSLIGQPPRMMPPELSDYDAIFASLNAAMATSPAKGIMTKKGKGGIYEAQDLQPGSLLATMPSEVSSKHWVYSVRKRIGQGNSGVVYTADKGDEKGELVAIKVMRISPTLKFIQRRLRSFLDESVIHAYVEEHDPENGANLLRFEEFVVHPKLPYIGAVMPLGGATLGSVISKTLGLRLLDIQRVAKIIASSLVHFERVGLTHSDLKPGNIMFLTEQWWKGDMETQTMEDLSSATDPRYQRYTTKAFKNRRKNFFAAASSSPPHVSKHRSTSSDRPILRQNVDETLRFIDLGAAQLVNFKSIENQRPPCTLYLRAPEDLYCIGKGQGRDVWALGMMLLEMYSGHKWITNLRELPYFEAWTALGLKIPNHLLNKPCPNPKAEATRQAYVKGVSHLAEDAVISIDDLMDTSEPWVEELRHLILECLTIDPEKRKSASELMSDPFLTAKLY